MLRRVMKIIFTVLVLLLFFGLLLFAHDDYDTMENWDWEYGEGYEKTFWQDLFGIEPGDDWEEWDGEETPDEEWDEDPDADWGADPDDGWDDGWDDVDWGEDDGDWDDADWDDADGEDDGGDGWDDAEWDEDGDWDGEDDGDGSGDGDEDDGEWDPNGPTFGGSVPEEDEDEDLRTRNIRMLARLIFGEARGVDSKVEQAAVAWCALNRLDAEGLGPEDLPLIVNSAHFGGYDKNDPVYPHHWDLAESVYDAWTEEHETGKLSSLRVLPREYLYYWGTRTHNWFVTDKSYIGSKRKAWSFSSRDPYASARRYYLRHYYPSDDEIDMMAQVLYHKARGVDSTMEQAAVVWCILNRVQSPLYEDTVYDVLTHEGQFSAYDPDLEVPGWIWRIVVDVVERWHREMTGKTNVGRVLPAEYLYFRADEHYEHNEFFIKPNGRTEWDWSLFNPYDD